ncbi:hypothetical protein [Lacrimispora indolis]|uniref:hypothetical protein n=1 Tax=Lacrimispora indolis TaxID=69825 RepID=UPI00045E8754|nr:hypothetical protein [Lacrimispora indolis]MBE7718024.1 glycoside hydrolase family 23 [Lacrimispora celerecrescens]
MNKIQTKKPLFSEISQQYRFQLKKFKKKKFYFKAKLILTVILPVLILVLSVKTAETFIRIKLRNLFAKPVPSSAPERTGEPVSIHAVPAEVEILHLQKVSEDS